MRTNVGGIARQAARLVARGALAGIFLWCGLGGAARASDVSYVYDRGDRLLAAFDGNGNYANYQYDMAGNITAIVRGGTSSVAVFGYSPDEGPFYSSPQITIYGLNFSPIPSQNTVQFGSTAATVISSTTNTIVATIPNFAHSLVTTVTVTCPAGSATGPNFYVLLPQRG